MNNKYKRELGDKILKVGVVMIVGVELAMIVMMISGV